MAYLNVKERVIEAKIVYYGAGLCGKTTNLEQVKKLSTDGKCGDMMVLDTDGDRTLFFDWLPFHVGKFKGCDVRIQLYTVPGQAKYAETRKRVLASADGIVLVLDSQSGALEKNRETLADLRSHMRDNNLDEQRVPVVIQLNKRDLPTAMAPNELLSAVGLGATPYVEAVASSGAGVFETLREATRLVLKTVREEVKQRAPEIGSGDSSGLDGSTLYAQLTGDGKTAAALATIQPIAASPPPPTRPHDAAFTTEIGDAKIAPPSRDLSPTQVNEVVAGQRALVRRMDALEVGLVQSIGAQVAALEKRLFARWGAMGESTKSVLDARLEQLASDLAAARVSDTARLEEVSDKIDGIRSLVSAVDKAMSELRAIQAALQSQLVALDTNGERRAVTVREQSEHAVGNAVSAIVDETRARSGVLVDALEKGVRRLDATQTQARAESADLRRVLEKDFAGELKKMETSLRSLQQTSASHVGKADEANHALVAMRGAVEESLRSVARGSESLRAELERRIDGAVGQRAAITEKAVEDTWQLTHHHFLTVDDQFRIVLEAINALIAELKQKRAWWR